MSTVSELLRPYPVPPAARVRQSFCADVLADVPGHLLAQLEANCAPIRPGHRIAITCGSRGIDQYVTLVRTAVEFVRAKGGEPFLVPSMGSHGGATAEGQTEVLHRFGITEESVGAPIVSSMGILGFGQ